MLTDHQKYIRTRLPRHIGFFGLLVSSLASVIGSGWLFGCWEAAKIAGPASILAWPIGTLIIALLAMNYMELAAAYPMAGGMARFAALTHGSLTGFMSGWSNWISTIAIIPIEAVATTQYISTLQIAGAHQLYLSDHQHLSITGLVLTGLFIVGYFLVNYVSLKLFLRLALVSTVIKLLVPSVTIVTLFIMAFHLNHVLSPAVTFMPYGFDHVLMAIAGSGVLFSFHGFQISINLAEDSKRAKRDVPIAILLTILISGVLYFLLQLVFVGSVSPSLLNHGWAQLNMSAPFVQLALSVNLNVLVLFLYLDAATSPSGTAVVYAATSNRLLQGMQRNGYLPFMRILHVAGKKSWPAFLVNVTLCFVLLYFFQSWSQLIGVVSVAIIISYVTGPVSVMVLRKLSPEISRPIKFPALSFVAPLSFVLTGCLLYWASWPLSGEIIFVILSGIPAYIYYEYKHHDNVPRHLRAGLWMIAYFLSMFLISYLGDASFGGRGVIPGRLVYVLIVAASLVFYRLGIASGWKTEAMQYFLKNHHFIQRKS